MNLFGQTHLLDIPPIPLLPTPKNGCIGLDGIAKRLDKLLVHESLFNRLGLMRSWVNSLSCLIIPLYFCNGVENLLGRFFPSNLTIHG